MRIRSISSHASVSLMGAIKDAVGAFCLLTSYQSFLTE